MTFAFGKGSTGLAARYRACIGALFVVAIATLSLSPPAQAAGECKDFYKKYAAESDFKVMVKGKKKDGTWCWWNGGFNSLEEARRSLLADCRREAKSCAVVYATDEKKYWSKKNADTICSSALRGGDRLSWDSSPFYAKYVTEAKRRGFSVEDCREKIGLTRLVGGKSNVRELGNGNLCKLALSSSNTAAWSDNTQAVMEAHARRLSVDDCRTKIGLSRLGGQTDDVSSLANGNLCKLALSSSNTAVWSENTQAVLEAHTRQLSIDDCRERIGLIRLASSSIGKTTLDNSSLCQRALDSANTSVWDEDASYVNEARRRGLSINDCRVALGLPPLSQPSAQPTTTTQAPTAPTLLSLNDICRQSLNADGSDWSPEASAAQARSQAAALGVTVADCRTKLGLTSTIADMSAPAPTATTAPLKKVALVIGNSAYRNAPELANPRNDADAIAAKLQGMDFDVVTGTDLDKRGTEAKIAEFVDKTAQADIALFFYAGHGIQVAGENYIVPVDATVEKPSAVDFELVNVSMVTNYLGGDGKVGIALLDACRNNPFTRSLSRALGNRGTAVGAGLAEVHANGGGLLVAFATAPGDVAADGDGMVDSPFTTALLRHLDTRGLEVELMMKRVKADVIAMTKNAQRPWTNSDLSREVYLAPGK